MTIAATGFFAFRTPLLPIEELLAWSADLTAPGAADDANALAAALASDRTELRRRLRDRVGRPEVREALFVASPSLDESLRFWIEQPDSERGRKVERTLVRYLARMAARPTPFGLFAGCSLGTFGASTRLVVEGRDRYRRHTRLDTDYLAALCEALGRDPALRLALTWHPNSSLYRTAGQVRYAESRVDGRSRSHQLVAAPLTPYLEATLARAAAGARLDELAGALVDDEVSLVEAREFIGELIDAQLLVSKLEPQVTGGEPIHDLDAQLRAAATAHPPAAGLADRLQEARVALADLDAAPLGVDPARYRAVADGLRELPAEVELARMFQVDMVKPSPEALLGPEPLAEIARAVSLLHRLSPPRPTDDAWARFRESFLQRYEGRTVPLTEVLDEELGIGFDRSTAASAEASPLLRDLDLDGAAAPARATSPYLDVLLQQLDQALRTGAREIVLDEPTLAKMAGDEAERRPLPDSLAVMATLAAASDAALAAGDFRLHVHGVAGPSGVNLLGRFCHGDAALEAHVRAHLRLEEECRADAIFVEIVHLPEGRIGNVLLRPCLRSWELPFLGRSGIDCKRQIAIDDLDVSLVGDRVVLHSRRLGREVIPRLTTAHNFAGATNLGAYRFLCALQSQDVPQLGFRWGELSDAPFLPRVRAGRLVLAPARWSIAASALAELTSARGAQRFVAAQALRRARDLPRWVGVVESDNVLPIDFDNVLSVETFAQLAQERERVVLHELAGFAEPCARGPEGSFAHELIVPLMTRTAPAATSTAVAPPTRALTPPTRSFGPGSEWLYAKVYTGTATANRILCEIVAAVVDEARRTQAADAWFFVRYADPDWHLRLRLHGDAARLSAEVLPNLGAAVEVARARGLVWRFGLDTYERELERYGGPDGIVASERLFFADSEAVLAMVQLLGGDEGKDAAWRLTLRGMDQLLDDLGLTLDEKHALVCRCRDAFKKERGVGGGLTRQLGDRFRAERLSLEALLDRGGDGASPFAEALAHLDRRSARLQAMIAELAAAEAAGRLTRSRSELAASYLHMHANRMLDSAARAQEVVLYDFLARLYEGLLARRKRKPLR